MRLGSIPAAGTRSYVGRRGTQSTEHHQQFLRRWHRRHIALRRVQRPYRSCFDQRWRVNARHQGEGDGNGLGLERLYLRRSRPLLFGQRQQPLVGFHQNDCAHEGWSAKPVGHVHAPDRQPSGCAGAIPLSGKRVLVYYGLVQRSRRPDLCCTVSTDLPPISVHGIIRQVS